MAERKTMPGDIEKLPPVPAKRWCLLILAICGFVTSFGAHVVATNLPSYAETVGAGALVIGLLIAVYDFAEVFAKPAAGLLADRRGMRLVLLWGLGVFIFGSLLFLIVSPKLLLLVRFTQGLGAAALSTVSIALVAKHFAQGRGRAFGIYNAVKGAGYVIAPASGGFIISYWNFRAIFIVSASVGLVALVLSLFLPRDVHRKDGMKDEDEKLTLRQFLLVFKEPILLPVYAIVLINMFLVGILFGFLPVYLHGIGYTSLESGSVVSVATLSYLLVQPLAGHLGDRFGMTRTVIAGLMLAALATTAITFASGVILAALAITAGLGIGTVWTNSDALVSLLARQDRLGTSIGAAQSFKELGDMAGPILVGLITQFYGVRTGFVSCGLLALLCLIPLVWFHAPQNDQPHARGGTNAGEMA
jgi:MFS family permease